MFPVRFEHHIHIESKAISVTVRGGLQRCEMLRIPYSLGNWLIDGDEIVSLKCRDLFLLSVRGVSKPQGLVRPERLGKLQQQKLH
jgi:hypothetical protein